MNYNMGDQVTYTRHGKAVTGTVAGTGTDVLGPYVLIAVPDGPDMRVRDGDPELRRI